MASFDNSVSRTRVRGPDGDLLLPNALDDIVLGKGGKLVARRDGGSTSFEIYDVDTLAKVADYDPPFALADSTVWKVTANGVLTGKDLTAGSSKSILVPNGCTIGSGRVNGRWAPLDSCVGGNEVIDVRSAEPPRYLTVPAGAELGDGFVLQLHTGTDANSLSTKEVLVTDLNNPALGQRRYGTILGRSIQPSSFRADGAGGAKFVYADPNARPRGRHAELAHTGPAAAPRTESRDQAGGQPTPPAGVDPPERTTDQLIELVSGGYLARSGSA